jgi:hypothetical protein
VPPSTTPPPLRAGYVLANKESAAWHGYKVTTLTVWDCQPLVVLGTPSPEERFQTFTASSVQFTGLLALDSIRGLSTSSGPRDTQPRGKVSNLDRLPGFEWIIQASACCLGFTYTYTPRHKIATANFNEAVALTPSSEKRVTTRCKTKHIFVPWRESVWASYGNGSSRPGVVPAHQRRLGSLHTTDTTGYIQLRTFWGWCFSCAPAFNRSSS